MNIETLTEQVLKLAPASRAQIAEILLESLLESLDYEADFLVSEAWRQEIQKRCKKIDADPSILIDGEKSRSPYEARAEYRTSVLRTPGLHLLYVRATLIRLQRNLKAG